MPQHPPSPSVGGKATQFPTVLIKSQSIKQKPGAEPKLHRCIIYKESQKLEHTANRTGTHGGRAGSELWNEGKNRLPLDSLPEDCSEKGIDLARNTSNAIFATETRPASAPPRELGRDPPCICLCSSQGDRGRGRSSGTCELSWLPGAGA